MRLLRQLFWVLLTLGVLFGVMMLFTYDVINATFSNGVSPLGRVGADYCRSDSASFNNKISGGLRTCTSVDATNSYIVAHVKTDGTWNQQPPFSANGGKCIVKSGISQWGFALGKRKSLISNRISFSHYFL